MIQLSRYMVAMAVSLMLVGVAAAGSLGDFEKAMRSAYSDYRVALFQTNTGNRDAAAQAVESFRQKWSALIAANAEAPPQYADDPGYVPTLTEVAAIADSAAAQVAEGKLAEAHGTLEEIRDQIADLHERNGITAFSDRMNVYHAKMEEILVGDYDGFSSAGLGDLREDAAVLAYLADDIATHPPAESADPAYEVLLNSVSDSVATLLVAVRSSDAVAVKQAINGLKVPYSKFFLKFG